MSCVELSVRRTADRGDIKALFVARVDGSGARQLTPWGINADSPDWSPDGRRIVFDTVIDHLGHTNRLMIVDADGSNLHDLTRDHGTTGIGRFDALRVEQSYNPVWSPDGTVIMFSHLELTIGGDFVAGLQTIRPDGTDQRSLSFGDEHQADWGLPRFSDSLAACARRVRCRDDCVIRPFPVLDVDRQGSTGYIEEV